MMNMLYKLLRYDNTKSNDNSPKKKFIKYKYTEKQAAIIIESCYIKYLKRKMKNQKRKEKRKLYRRIKRTNPKFLKNISEIKQNNYVR